MAVTMCLCYGHTFEEVKEAVKEHGWTTVAEIGKEMGCGTGCGLCRPYLARMLETGETEFEAMKEVKQPSDKPKWSWKGFGK
jgi:bacterioferritin-associated ferredoxin